MFGIRKDYTSDLNTSNQTDNYFKVNPKTNAKWFKGSMYKSGYK